MNAQKYYYVVVKNPLELNEMSNNQNDYETIVYVTTDGGTPINGKWSHSRHETLQEAIQTADKLAAQLGQENGLGADWRAAADYAAVNGLEYAVKAGIYEPVADAAVADVMSADEFFDILRDVVKSRSVDTVVNQVAVNTGCKIEPYQMKNWLYKMARKIETDCWDSLSRDLSTDEFAACLLAQSDADKYFVIS